MRPVRSGLTVMDHQSHITSGKPFTEMVRGLNVTSWMSLAAMFLSIVSVISMAIAGWRATDTALARAAEINAQQRAFNRDLVFAIKDLAEQTGILTSAEHCPVRFRLRLPQADVPARRIKGTLNRQLSDDELQNCGSGFATAGMLDFGLQPPGRYRLDLGTPEGMFLTHEFDVLPGVPVDRVVICPNVGPSQEVLADVEVTVNWPDEFAAGELAALIEIEPGPFVEGEWRWEQTLDWPLTVLATSRLDSELSLAMIQHWMTHDTPLDDLHPEVLSLNSVQVPFRYCRVHAITFIHRIRDKQSGEQWRTLGTIVYGTNERQDADTESSWESAEPPPLYEVMPEFPNHWTVDVPEDCVDRIVRRLQATKVAPTNAT